MLDNEENEKNFIYRLSKLEGVINEIYETIKKIDRQSIIDIKNEMFIGLFLSLGILFLTYPTNEELIKLFKIFTENIKTIKLYSLIIRTMLTGSLIGSSILRYFGVVVKRDYRFLHASTEMILFSFLGVIHIILYGLIWGFLLKIRIEFIFLPAVLLLLNKYLIYRFERWWLEFFNRNILRLDVDLYISEIFEGFNFGILTFLALFLLNIIYTTTLANIVFAVSFIIYVIMCYIKKN